MTNPNDYRSQVLLTAAQVRALYGGVSDMTLWRWLHDPDLGFPKPIRIRKRRYFCEQAIRRHRESEIQRSAYLNSSQTREAA